MCLKYLPNRSAVPTHFANLIVSERSLHIDLKKTISHA